MLYLPEKNAAILHIPRTGGNWIIEATERLGIEHEVRQWKRLPRELYRRPILDKHCIPEERFDFVAAFVRHPVSYYESIWRWMAKVRSLRSFMIRCSRHGHWSPFLKPYRCWDRGIDSVPDFDVWVRRMVDRFPGWITELFEMYARDCQFVGRTESLTEDYQRMLQLLGHDVGCRQFERVNVNDEIERPNWNGSKQMVIDSEKIAIDRWFSK